MGKVRPLGVLDCWYSPAGGYKLTMAGEFNKCFLDDALAERCRNGDGKVRVRVVVEPVVSARSLRQNDLMWALLTLLAEQLSGHPPSAEEVQHTYRDMLVQYGNNVDYLIVPQKALDTIRRAYRVVQVIEYYPGGSVQVAAIAGSSTFTKEQMRDFIDRLFDRLVSEGVRDPRLPDWRRQHERDQV